MKFKNASQRKAVMAKIRLMKDGKVMGRYPSENEALKALQNKQPFSWDYAQKHGGWKIVKAKDTDKDGVPDDVDCAPNNPKRHYMISQVSDKDKLSQIRFRIADRLRKKGYKVDVEFKGDNIMLRNIRLDTTKRPHNWREKSLYSDDGMKKTNVLGWNDWVEVNNTVNGVLDNAGVNANVKSMGGKFDIRDKKEGRRTERDWDNLAGENVGSRMRYVSREDLILSKDRAVTDGLLTKAQLRKLNPKKPRRRVKPLTRSKEKSTFNYMIDNWTKAR